MFLSVTVLVPFSGKIEGNPEALYNKKKGG